MPVSLSVKASRADLHPKPEDLRFSRVLWKEKNTSLNHFQITKNGFLAHQYCLHCRNETHLLKETSHVPSSPYTDLAFMSLH